MFQLPDRVVGDAYTSSRGLDLVASLVELDHRMPGSEGEREAAHIIADWFREDGLDDVTVTEFPIPRWERGDAALTLDRGEQYEHPHEVVALPGSPDASASGELVDMGDALPEQLQNADLDGKVVLASSNTPDDYGRWVHRIEKYAHAVRAGADAFVFVNHVDGNLPPTGDIGDRTGPGPIPAIGVSKEVGAELRRYCEEDTVDATVAVDCVTGDATSRTVEATVGPDTDEEVVFTAHVDAHDIGDGANDNGTGCALVAEVGRLLKQVEDDLETRVRLVTFGAEETGLYGSYHYAETRDLSDVKCLLNVDGAGYSRNLAIYTHGNDDIGEVFDAVSDAFDVPVKVSSAIRPHSDHWPFVQKGVAGGYAKTTSGGNDRGWGHTHADTFDKLDVRDVRDVAVLLATGVGTLAEADREIEPVPESEVRDATIEQDFDTDMKAIGSWPWADEPRVWPWDDDASSASNDDA